MFQRHEYADAEAESSLVSEMTYMVFEVLHSLNVASFSFPHLHQ